MDLATLAYDQETIDMTTMEREFIKCYEGLPLLWKRDHPDYSNKFKRNHAYDILLPILRKFMPIANKFNVRQKINILRSTYRKELRRYLASKTITSDGEIIYTHVSPSWKFEAMNFLKDQNENDYKIKSEIVIEETVEDGSFNDLEDQELVFIEDGRIESGNEDFNNLDDPVSFVKEKKPIIVKNPRKRTKKTNEGLIIDRECSAVGSNVTCKLQRMSTNQRYYAEQLINKVLMSGLREALTEETDLIDYIIDGPRNEVIEREPSI